jgi:glycosyltransferase involved in cell wall biosynthesis
VGVQGLAMGLAMALSRVGGNVDLVAAEENGFLIDLAETDGFEKALRFLLGRPQQLLACRNASRRQAEKFALMSVVKSYDQIFTHVTQPKNES